MIHWDERQFVEQVKQARGRALQDACKLLTASIKAHFPGSGIPGAGKKEREANRSQAGEIPHVQTGTLKRSIGWEIEGDEGRVGAQLGFTDEGGEDAGNYAYYLEKGTRTMAARPFLRPGLDREAKAIEKAFEGKLP